MKGPTLCIGLLLVSVDALATESGQRARNQRLVDLTPNHWVELHVQQPDDDVHFRRQGHGGSCFDTKRGRLILFGSDTHGKNWENSPLSFDPWNVTWSTTRATNACF